MSQREVTGDEDALLAQARKQGADSVQLTERTAFIRQAAIALYAGPLDFDKEDAWHAAQVLWDAKPEDC